MPGAGTHTTIIQHLAQESPAFQQLLGDPALNKSWDTYQTDEALKSRYAILGAMGPDIFYAMLDYGGGMQKFEDVVIKIAGTFQCVGELNAEINNYIDRTANSITNGVWDSIQATINYLGGILKDSLLDLLISKHNFWSLFLPLRQVDDYRQNWYWADFLHYVKTGCFTKKLLDMCRTYSSDPRTSSFLKAYSLGYLTHYVADTVGHAWVNRIVESPWRNCWQRHHLVENFIDAYVWDHWHNPSDVPQKPADEQGLDDILDKTTVHGPSRKIGDGAPLHYSRLNDFCNIGSAGIDPRIDSAISSVCESIQKGAFEIGVSSVPTFQAPDDPAFITWTNFMSDAIWETYPPTFPLENLQDHPMKLSSGSPLLCPDPGGYPSPDDIAGAYGVYRLVLSLATEDKVDAPKLPDIAGDLSKILDQLWNEIKQNLGGIQSPPSVPTSGSFSLDALWDAIKSYAQWLGQVLVAVLKTIGDIIVAAMQGGSAIVNDAIKVGLYVLNSILFALYHSVRMPLVMSAYSVPLTEDLTGKAGPLDLQTLWKASREDMPQYPIEPVLSERDLTSDSSHPHSPYRPYFRPSTTQPVNIEMPPTRPPVELLTWTTPDQMLETPIGKDAMLSANGPAPPTTEQFPNPDGSLNAAVLETFDGSQRYFGGIFANCEAALSLAVPYVSGMPMPTGTLFPDYNLDSDRGYAWPCWDVDYGYPNAKTPFPWNGCDPFPDDTLNRTKLSTINGGIDWGKPDPPRPNLLPQDPWRNSRSGKAWVNAVALNLHGDCGYADLPFPFLVIDPNDPTRSDLRNLDVCNPPPANPNAPGPPSDPTPGILPNDYQFAPPWLLQQDQHDYLITDKGLKEFDGRLLDFLRNQAKLPDQPDPLHSRRILANAVTLLLGLGTTLGPSPIAPNDPSNHFPSLVTALAQLAVTGRTSFEQFALNPPQEADLVANVKNFNAGANFDPVLLKNAAHKILDIAYTALWAIRGNDPGWRDFRSELGWIAVSGFDDTPHRPVNVPTAPYSQFDISLNVPPFDGKTKPLITTRYMVASAHTFIGPNDSKKSSFTLPGDIQAAALLQAPSPTTPLSGAPAPRTIPPDNPSIPPGDEIIVYIHGGGSRAEEAVGLANCLIQEGAQNGHSYTVVSFDLPNSAYATAFQVTDVVGSKYDSHALHILDFEVQYIINFIEKLDEKLGNVKNRIVAVMGGSLGGNTSLLLSGKDAVGHPYLDTYPYLKTIVSWSVTATAPTTIGHLISKGSVGAHLGKLEENATKIELFDDHKTETDYIHAQYFEALVDHAPIPYVPRQPLMWYRAPDWQECKDSFMAQSRFDRYEIYSDKMRHWTCAIDLEQIWLGFQDNCLYFAIAASPASHLLLAAGYKDNYNLNPICNSTMDVARLIRHTAHGKAEFWLNTGHSIHDERPQLLAKEIVYFLTHLDAKDSPYGKVVVPPDPQPAPPSEVDK